MIVDCNYTLEEAVAGSKAPKKILSQLQLINVQYYSTDGKIHQGQILTNRKMVNRLEVMFQFMKQVKFPVVHAIPVVKYNWNDDLSMQANNTYSFCYRNPSYSKHARGMAIDINPYFNPLRWKEGYTYRQNKPVGASYNPSVSGTFYDSNPVVLEFRKNGLRWGRTFSRKYDDHHFEM
ncbi:MAG TPA: M15 family metallopeptidase [Paludibacter sp.]